MLYSVIQLWTSMVGYVGFFIRHPIVVFLFFIRHSVVVFLFFIRHSVVIFLSVGDASHITAPSEDGHGAQLCMTRAMNDAQVDSNQVGYINAHATSTPLGKVNQN